MMSAPSERSPSPSNSNRNPGVSSVQTKVIEPSRGARFPDLRELWRYRDLLGVLLRRDLKVRYQQTVVGVLWVILRPLASMAIFTVVFGFLIRIPSDGYPYALFVLAGLLPWGYFSNAVLSSGGSLVSSASLIGKVYFPRILIPAASVGGELLDLLISSLFLVAIAPLFGVGWTANLLALPVLILGLVAAAFGVGTLVSALTVAYRDFGSISGYALQIWMYATPVIYPESLVPERWRFLLLFNPMAALVEGFRSAVLGKEFHVASLCVSFAISLAMLAVGAAYFGKVERRFADIL